jgi:peptidoglycan/LPS O-acetylase OafA/YrhL
MIKLLFIALLISIVLAFLFINILNITEYIYQLEIFILLFLLIGGIIYYINKDKLKGLSKSNSNIIINDFENKIIIYGIISIIIFCLLYYIYNIISIGAKTPIGKLLIIGLILFFIIVIGIYSISNDLNNLIIF